VARKAALHSPLFDQLNKQKRGENRSITARILTAKLGLRLPSARAHSPALVARRQQSAATVATSSHQWPATVSRTRTELAPLNPQT